MVEPTLYLVGVGSTSHPVQPHMNKCLKKINMMGYMVFFKDGHHHQLMKAEKIKYKKKKAKHEVLATFGEWVSGGEESSTSSSDGSFKRFTTRTNMGLSSSNI